MGSLVFDNVSVTAGGRQILKDVSFEFEGRRLAIIGANGSGKSTLLRLINGLIRPMAGRIFLNGQKVKPGNKTLKRQVGFVFQNPDAQIIMPTVEEDIRFGLQQWKVPADDQDRLIEEALEEFELTALKDQSCYSLSGGEKQRLALAAVMVLQPDWLMLDEPTTLLDFRSARDFRQRLSRFEQTVLLASHRFEDFSEFEQALVLQEGALVFEGSVAKSIAYYESMEAL